MNHSTSRLHKSEPPYTPSGSRSFPIRIFRAVEASIRLGIPVVSDANSPDESSIGIVPIHQTITPTGQRNSTYHAFLPLSYRKTHRNLTVCTNTLARKIDVSTSDGQVHASGVFLQAVKGHTVYHVRARKEIVLACGALFSPQLLMLR
jgi:choline dehydrogenase